MTERLRQALIEADSLYGVAKCTRVDKASLVRFVSGRQSLRLDKADMLAAFFGLELTPVKRRRQKGAGRG
jgi:plasmid maintenance system antidote protein VapI